MVAPVVEEEPLPLAPGAEVGPQQRQYPVFGPDLSGEDAAEVREPDKALKKVGLAL